jgi:dihydroflavonol-4-reductase
VKVALTGATGFLGIALAERLAAEGHALVALVRPTSAPAARAALEGLGARLLPGDVTDASSLPPLCAGADLVLHVAAVIGYRRRLSAAMQRVNVEGTRHVLAACRAAGGGTSWAARTSSCTSCWRASATPWAGRGARPCCRRSWAPGCAPR